MRLVIAFCGVLSGAAALGFGWWGQQGLLLETRSLSEALYVLIVLAIHLIALTSIAGGMAVLVAPSVGRIAMLSSAVGWLLLIAILGGGIRPAVGLLILLSAAGGLAAFLPGLQMPLFRLERVEGPVWQPTSRGRSSARRPERDLAAPRAPLVYEDLAKPFVSPYEPEEEDHSRPFVAPPPEAVPAIGAVGRRDYYGSRRDGRRSAASRPRRREGGRWRRALGVVALILVVGGTGIVLLYDSLPREGTTALPATASVAELSSSSASPSGAGSSSSAASSSEEQDRLPIGPAVLLPASGQAAVASASSASEIDLGAESSSVPAPSSSESPLSSLLPPVDAAMASLPPITPPSSFKSPFEYCASVPNIDSPDATKLTAGLAELTAQARDDARMPKGEVRWRCMENAVWVCVQPAGALSCDKVPSATDRVLICASHPDTPGIRNAGGDWSCNGFTPVVSAAQLNVADHRGFDKAAWKKLEPLATGAD